MCCKSDVEWQAGKEHLASTFLCLPLDEYSGPRTYFLTLCLQYSHFKVTEVVQTLNGGRRNAFEL